jgi:hypothetical protein
MMARSFETGELVTQTPSASSAEPNVPAPQAAGESFLAVTWRRTRYVVAVALSAVLFSWLGWSFARPPAEWSGVSLMAWPGQGLISAFILMGILLLATAICSLIVHPDSPHMGLFCSLLGMAGLSIRGGTVHMLMVYGQTTGKMPAVADALAWECVVWGCVIVLADLFARWVHDKWLANDHWLLRATPERAQKFARTDLGKAAGFSKTMSAWLHTDRITGPLRIPLAMVCSGAIAYLLLNVLMQSELKGQVLMACFVAFLVSTVCAYAAFPTTPFWAFVLAVPLTGAVMYLVGRNVVPRYPGHAAFFAMRALPIDYLTVGVAGAILGWYKGLEWAMGGAEE